MPSDITTPGVNPAKLPAILASIPASRSVAVAAEPAPLSLNKPKLDNLAGDIWKSAERLRGKKEEDASATESAAATEAQAAKRSAGRKSSASRKTGGSSKGNPSRRLGDLRTCSTGSSANRAPWRVEGERRRSEKVSNDLSTSYVEWRKVMFVQVEDLSAKVRSS